MFYWQYKGYADYEEDAKMMIPTKEPEGWVPYNQRRQVEKKILPQYFKEVRTHRKMFEIRKDEDNIQVGDILVLREWDGEKYTGNKTRREVTYILRDAPQYGLMEGYCILSLQVPGWDFVRPAATLDYSLQDKITEVL